MLTEPNRSSPGPPLKIHHVAFAHGETSAPHDRFEVLLGMAVCHEEEASGFTERMIPVGEGFVQTLEATGPGLVERFVNKRGPALHHIAFEVEGLEEYLRWLQGRGVRLIDETPRPGGMGTMIAFVHPREFGGLLVELVDSVHYQ